MKRKTPTIVAVCTFLTACFSARTLFALTNNVALTPPMGWNDWNAYQCGTSEYVITNNAGIIAASGMQAAGYQFVDIDDGWAATRDSNGVIQAYSVPGKFPDGIPWLANYVHGMGLKLGLYTDDGTNTCSSCISTSINPIGKDPGSYEYEYIDAFTYASWGADYLKDDNCNATGLSGEANYGRMSDGLLKSGRPIVFCLCGGQEGNAKMYQSWSPTIGNYWRTTGDIGSTFASMISHIDPNSTSAFVAGPGRWNDPDMMEIGNGQFATNLVAAQTHFTMWCEMAAPLIAGNNLTTMSAGTLAILTNIEAIAVDQDPAGEQGTFVGGIKDTAEVWSKPLGYDFTTRAVALLNRQTSASANITCYFTNLAFQPNTTATVRDLWGHTNLGTFTNSFTATVPAYGSMLLKIVGTPVSAPLPGTNYLSNLQPIYAYTGFGTIVPNKSIGGNTIMLGGVPYAEGIGVNSRSGVEYNLGGVCTQFQTTVGIDDEEGANGSVIFEVFADGAQIYMSPPLTGSSAPLTINLDVSGVRRLTLGVDDDNDGTTDDHADWANALVIATNTPQVPEQPTGLIASPGSPIRLNWNTTLAGITYNVKRATTTGGPYTTIGNVPISTFTDSNVVAGMPYYYVVSAVSSIGEGSNSVEMSATSCDVAAAPTDVVTTPGISQIVVSWNASPGATSYSVYRFTGSTLPVIIASNLSTTSFTDAPLAGNSTNYYFVTAANACNQSGYSLYAPGVTPPGPPGVPTGLFATPGNALVELTWNIAVNATGYNVKRSTTNGGPYTVIANDIVSTMYLDDTVTNGATYYYVVSAINSGDESQNSAQVSVTPALPVTAYWTNTASASAQNWNVNANWTNASAFPNAIGESAVINAGLTAPQTINLNQAITVGAIEIGDANAVASYTVAANGGSLTFDGAGPASITQLTSSQGDVLATPISLLNNLIVANESPNPFTLAGPLSSSGGVALTINSGVLQVGNGTTDGTLGSVNVTNNEALVFNCSGSETSSGVITGSGSLTTKGTGTVTLSAAETYTGQTVINGGILALDAGNNGNSGVYLSSGIVINNGGALQVDTDNSLTGSSGNNIVPITINAGGTLTGLSTADSGAGTSTHIRGLLTLDGGTLAMAGTQNQPSFGTWDLDGGVAVNGGAIMSTINCLNVDPSQSGGTVFNVARGGTSSGIDLLVSGTFLHGGSEGDTGIIKTGNGNMTLEGVNSYTGNTHVNGGTLALTGSASINSSAQVAVNNATLDLSGLTAPACANSQFALTNAILVLSIPSTATISETAATLNLGGAANVINITSLPAVSSYPQLYHLISYTTLNGAFNIALGSLPAGMALTGYVTNSVGFVNLVVTTNGAPTPSQLVWTGTDPSHPNNWDVGLSQNWTSNGIAATYNQDDGVTFSDAATGQTNVDLMTVLTPSSLTVSNSTLIYNLGAAGQGGGRISGVTGIAKRGTNLLILDESNSSGSYNDFSGGLTISSGAVQVGNGDANGAVGTGPVVNNGALVFDHTDSITVANVISGSGGVTQNGTGILILSGANSFLGPVAVAQGTLQIGSASALGATNGGATVENGATLNVNGTSLGNELVTASGAGVNREGAVYNGGAQITSGIRYLTLAGDTTLGGTGPFNPTDNIGRWDVRGTNNNDVSGTLSTGGHPYKLTKVGSNQVSIVAINVDPQLGDVDIQMGLMGWETVTTSMGNPSSNLFVRAGATLSFYNASTAWNKNFVLFGNGTTPTVTNWSGANTIIGPVQLNGGCVFWGGGTSLTLGGVISGTGSLIKNGTYSLILTNANYYTGNTMVNAGTLTLSGNGSIAKSPDITIASGATLSASTLTLTSGQTLQGNGSVSGNLLAAAGATVAPIGAPGALAVSGTAILGGTTLLELNKTAATNGMLTAGEIIYGGTLTLTNLSGTVAAGDSFKLFNATTYSGAFSNITPAIPGLNLAWNTNSLNTGVVSVVSQPTPSPGFSMSVGANGMVFAGSNGVPGWPYYLLATTNVGTPLSNWTTLFSNSFDGSGNFVFTNNPGSNSQQFFILQLP